MSLKQVLLDDLKAAMKEKTISKKCYNYGQSGILQIER